MTCPTRSQVAVLGLLTLTAIRQSPLTAQEPHGWRYDSLTPAGLEAYADSQIAAAGDILERMLRQRGPRTVENTLRQWDEMRIRANAARVVSYLRVSHPDSAIRAAAGRAESRIAAFNAKLRVNRRAYEAIVAIDTTGADAETRFYLNQIRRLYHQAGIDRDDATRARIAALREAITALEQRFQTNVLSDSMALAFDTGSALAGVPPEWLQARRHGPRGEIIVAGPDLDALVRLAANPETRERAYVTANNRAPANRAILDSLLAARYELATIYGARSWAEWQLRETMAGSPEGARAFLAELRRRSEAVNRRDVAQATERLRAAGDTPAIPLPVSDYAYQNRRTGPDVPGAPGAALRVYFPYARVRDSLLALARELIGLEFRPAPDLSVWHPSVEPYRVYDGGRLAGIAYFDLHLRAGKDPRNASTSLIRTGVRGRVVPEVVILGGVLRGDPGDPQLMGPVAVGTLFHEFGHLVHFIVSTRPWWGTSGLPDEFDFREVPSILFERLAQDPTVFRRFARHYQTDAPIPDSLVGQVGSFGPNGALITGHWRSLMSLALHEGPPESTDSIVRATFAEAQPPGAPLLALPDSAIHPEWMFYHLATYEAAYYTYQWSGAVAIDLISKFEHGLLDTAMTHRYRREILEPGGSRSAMAMVESFLGRPFSLDAWAATISAPPARP
jgi:thimet oligopeptidase